MARTIQRHRTYVRAYPPAQYYKPSRRVPCRTYVRAYLYGTTSHLGECRAERMCVHTCMVLQAISASAVQNVCACIHTCTVLQAISASTVHTYSSSKIDTIKNDIVKGRKLQHPNEDQNICVRRQKTEIRQTKQKNKMRHNKMSVLKVDRAESRFINRSRRK